MHARINYVGKYQSCAVLKWPINSTRVVGDMVGTCNTQSAVAVSDDHPHSSPPPFWLQAALFLRRPYLCAAERLNGTTHDILTEYNLRVVIACLDCAGCVRRWRPLPRPRPSPPPPSHVPIQSFVDGRSTHPFPFVKRRFISVRRARAAASQKREMFEKKNGRE